MKRANHMLAAAIGVALVAILLGLFIGTGAPKATPNPPMATASTHPATAPQIAATQMSAPPGADQQVVAQVPPDMAQGAPMVVTPAGMPAGMPPGTSIQMAGLPPADLLPADYAILKTRSVFGLHNRGSGAAPAGPEANLVFRGAVEAGGLFTAFIEDMTAKRVMQLAVGDALGRGHVKSITLDAIDYEAAGASHHVERGQNLMGMEVQPPPPPASQPSGPPNGNPAGRGPRGRGGMPPGAMQLPPGAMPPNMGNVQMQMSQPSNDDQ